MSDDDRIDLGPLDPARDPQRWAGMVNSVVARARARRAAASIPGQIVAWARPTLFVAAALASILWVRPLLRGSATTAASADPACVLADWAVNDEMPATTRILEILGGNDGRR